MTVKDAVLEQQSAKSYAGRKKQKNQDGLRAARIVQVTMFLGALFLFGVLSLTLPRQSYSKVEKRDLAAMPEFSVRALTQGTYTRDLENHYADTFPFRDGFVSIAARIDEMRGIRFDEVRIYGSAAPQNQDAASLPPEPEQENPIPAVMEPSSRSEDSSTADEPSQAPKPEFTETPPVVVDDGAVGEQMGAVFVYKDKAMSIFGGSNAAAERYARAVSSYQEAWGKEVQVYDLVIPTAIEFALPDRYKSVSSPQGPNIKHIYGSLTGGVIPVDAYGKIAAHTGEYLYFNSDHHWTALGAYYAYLAYAEAAGLTPLELSQYEKRTITGFRGTMYAYTNDAALGEDYVDFYRMPLECEAIRYDLNDPFTPKAHSVWAEYAAGENSYSVFLHGDFPLIKITTENKNGRKALVVKESFGNAFSPFLIPHYEEVHVVDQRYFLPSLTAYVQQNGIQDVLFVNNIFAANTKYHIDKIEEMVNDRTVSA